MTELSEVLKDMTEKFLAGECPKCESPDRVIDYHQQGFKECNACDIIWKHTNWAIHKQKYLDTETA